MLNLPNPGIPRIALTALAVLSMTGPAWAQSDRDLRQENQRLQTQTREMQRELDAARDRIAELKREIRVLVRSLGQSARSTADPAVQPDAERVTIDESLPNSSPRALLIAVSDSYVDATSDLEIGDFNSTAGERARRGYVRAVQTWANRIRREMKSPVEWHIRILPRAEQTDERAGIRVRAVDPETGVELGEPFIVTINKTLRRKLTQLDQRGPIEALVLKGVLIPDATVNPDRKEPGPFNNPRLIGPFAEFEFTVEASSLTPPRKRAGSGRRDRP